MLACRILFVLLHDETVSAGDTTYEKREKLKPCVEYVYLADQNNVQKCLST